MQTIPKVISGGQPELIEPRLNWAPSHKLPWPAGCPTGAQGGRWRHRCQQREVKGVQSPSVTLSAGSGSCRDMATLMLEALRSVGLPARFASGYLECAASEAGRASTHAWAEAYLPCVGWIGYDPMSGEATAGKHIVVGVSNHPRGVMPVSGTFFDDQNSYLGMKIAVQTVRFVGTRTPSRLFRNDQSKPASLD